MHDPARHDDDAARILGRYLNAHLLASEGGLRSFTASLDTWEGSEHEAQLRFVVEDVERDRRDLAGLIRSLGQQPAVWKRLLTSVFRLGGRAGLLNPLRRRDGASAQLELDTLTGMLNTKLSMWEALLASADAIPGLDVEAVRTLKARAEQQIEAVQAVSRATARDRLGQARA